ncbi:MAG TPA: peptide-methionine (S)-S-oxide reductase MsrA [Phycisphaerales bacterium]|nr:peptide-methionine (S)-S-oxide reductase MsrA [Phycisphaerales bacterium]
MQQEIATFGAGCFWGVEATFRLIPGVTDAACGYSGGSTINPTYKQVCTDTTGHAEVVQITFDPSKVSYESIVDTFFRMHDPTQLNRQGPDYGSQYRSVIFYHSPEQQKTAEAVKARRQASGKYKRPIVTTIEPAHTFYRAEEYHQEYFKKNGLENHCHLPQPD